MLLPSRRSKDCTYVSAKYEVILRLATVVFLSDKSHREEGEEKKEKQNEQFQIGFCAAAQKPKNLNNFKEVSALSHENLKFEQFQRGFRAVARKPNKYCHSIFIEYEVFLCKKY